MNNDDPRLLEALDKFTPETLPADALPPYLECYSFTNGQSRADGVYIHPEQIEFESLRYALGEWLEGRTGSGYYCK